MRSTRGDSGAAVLVLHRTAQRPEFTAEDVRFVEAVANVLASALDRAHAEAESRRRALHDPLTGLANRAFLDAHIPQSLAAAARDGREVALLLLDLDRFKVVNDTLGHGAGDALLRVVAAAPARRASAAATSWRASAATSSWSRATSPAPSWRSPRSPSG